MSSEHHIPAGTPPTSEQLTAARLRQWHQTGEALLTFENLRSWINATGLALFTARPTQLPAPAPSLVEAVLGAPNANPIPADTEQARPLLARLIAEAVVVPLNLLGGPGETPDFVVAAPVFSYIFTLRGDKAWKQPPATVGAFKVSPLALATYQMLAERVTLSAYDLATQLGKEVTESAVLRALNELWIHLRVLPVPQPDGAATLWELTTGRFTKIVKAGANAGQPSALSALISLYLNTAIVATEDEIETFLSPLAARSRIRDVMHALLSARELETIAVDGRTVLHVRGELPASLAPEGSIVIEREPPIAAETSPLTEAQADGEDAPRIAKFVPKPRKTGTGFIARPAKPGFSPRPGPSPRPGARPDRERRPFTGKAAGDPARPSFTKPWQERKPRDLAASSDQASPPRSYPGRPRPDGGAGRPRFDGRPFVGPGPGANGDRPARAPFSGKPRDRGDSRPPRRDFKPRAEGDGLRPPRRDFASGPNAAGGGEARPPRRQSLPREGGDRPAFGGPRKPGSFSARPQGGPGDRKPFAARGARPANAAPRYGGTGKPDGGTGKPDRRARADGPPFRRFDTPRGERPARPAFGPGGRAAASDGPGGKFAGKAPAKFHGKPGGKSAGRPATGKFAGKPGAGKPAGTFDKFKNKAKPFGNRPPARRYRPEDSEPGQ